MPHRCLSLQLVLLVGLANSTRGADDKPATFDKQLDKALHQIIDRGADLYNNGDQAGCARLFEGALRALRPVLGQRPRLGTIIERGLAAARDAAAADRQAFLLREALDYLRAELNPPKPGDAQPAGGFTLSTQEQAILDLTNAERKKAGLPALKANEKLFQAARTHAANMARLDQLNHTLEGKDPGDRLRAVGYRAGTWGENVAAGQRTPTEALTTWMNSEGHRKNLLGDQFTEIGIGVAATAEGKRYYTQVFGTPGAP